MVQSVAVASGKGGVGKTSLAVNCAIQFTNSQKKVALLDADFGLANAHIMLNQKVDKNISDLLEGTCNIQDIICEVPPGLLLIPGGSGVLEIMNIDSRKRWEIIRSLDVLGEEIDYLFVDTPAGASDASIEFAAACDKILIVLVGEPTSFMDAYAFIKALNIEKDIGKVSVVVNMAANKKAAETSFSSFSKIVSQFLQVDLEFAGWLPNSSIIKNSIISRKPFSLNLKSNSDLLSNLSSISNHIDDTPAFRSGNIRFFDR